MKTQCVSMVEKILKRPLTKGEADAIDARISANVREAARTDPNFASKTRETRLLEAAQLALAQDSAIAAKAAQRKASNVLAQIRESQRLTQRASQLKGKTKWHAALQERMLNASQYINGVRSEMMESIMDTIHAAEPKFLGLMHSPQAMRDFVLEVYKPGSTGSPIAQKGAKAYLEAMEKIRLRSNEAGASIGKLDYGYLPQPHDLRKVTNEKAGGGKDAWVQHVVGRVDRSRYVKEDGSQMNDAELKTFLEHAYDTISTEGRNKLIPGASGKGSRAARFDEAHRAIHFKDVDSYLSYMNKFGRAGSVFEAINGHIGMAAKNIGMLEEFGATPNNTYRLLKDMAEKGDNATGKRDMLATLDMTWDMLNGTTAAPVSARLAAAGNGIRTFIAAVKLQGVLLSSLNDLPLLAASAFHNGMPIGKTLATSLKALSGNIQKDAGRILKTVDYITGEMSRWHADNMTAGWTSKLADTTHKLSFIEAWTHRLRQGFTLMHSATLNDLRSKAWSNLDAFDRGRLDAGGVTEADWKIWRLAKATDYKGMKLLSPEGLRNLTQAQTGHADFVEHEAAINRATARLLGFMDQESHNAVLSPDLITRAGITQGTKAGTPGGEFLRSLMLFKSFPLAMVNQNLRRMRTMDGKGKAAYSIATMTSLTLMGSLSMQLKDMLMGKDPRDMTTGKFWGAAFAQGGGLGIFGDIAYTGLGGNSRGGQPNWTGLAGPVIGTALDLANVTIGNAGQALQGKDAKLGAELFRIGRQNTPLINLWYLKAALGHAVLDDIQDQISPGYLARQKKATYDSWKQRYWWNPGDKLPARPPDLSAVNGG